MRKIKVGIIQQANASDIRINLMNLAKSIEACAANGAQLVVLQELHNSRYPYMLLLTINKSGAQRGAAARPVT